MPHLAPPPHLHLTFPETYHRQKQEYQLNELSKKIIATIKSVGVTHSTKLPDYVLSNPRFAGILKGAELLFSGIDDIHSEEGLQKITQRYLDNKAELEKLAPLSVQ